MPSLTIGIDGSFLARDDRGMGRSIRAILDCWKTTVQHRMVLLCHQRRHLAGLKRYADAGWEVKLASQAPSLDVCWFPWSRVDWETPCPRVAFIHDVVPFTGFHTDAHRQADQRRLRQAAARATRVMTNSQFSRMEILRHLVPANETIDVVPLAYDPAVFHDRPLEGALPAGLTPRGYMLYVGNLEPRKNLHGLLEALALGKVELPLALVCPRPTQTLPERLLGKPPALHRRIRELGNRLIWVVASEDTTLTRLYQNARLFVMPSLYEGFGLPLLEAMACGCPTAAARAASLPEVGGTVPEWFDPESPPDISRALARSQNAPLSASGPALQQASLFSWTETARRTLEILESAAAGAARQIPKQPA